MSPSIIAIPHLGSAFTRALAIYYNVCWIRILGNDCSPRSYDQIAQYRPSTSAILVGWLGTWQSYLSRLCTLAVMGLGHRMMNLELPLGKRTKLYRFFEIVPAVISYGMLILLVILSVVNPLWAAIYLLLLIITVFVKSIGIAYHTIRGHNRLVNAQRIDWHERPDSS